MGKTRLLIDTLTNLFNSCLETNNFPKQWLEIIITPIYKKWDKALLENYRPILLVSCQTKICMSIRPTRLSDWATENQILPQEQTVFHRQMGCQDQILILNSLIFHRLSRTCYIELCLNFHIKHQNMCWL